MIVLLYGPDSYRRLQKLQELRRAYRSKRGTLGEEHFDLKEEGAVAAFKNFIANRSMFDDAKLVALDNAYQGAEDVEFREVLKNERDSKNSLILISEDNKPPAKLDFLLKPPIRSQLFKALTDAQLRFFISKEAAARGLRLQSDILQSMEDVFRSDTWSIVTELDKMALAANHFEPQRPRTDYYLLINTLKGRNNFKNKIVALEMMLSERRDDPARIFNSLSYRLNNKKEAALLADYDVAVKSGKLDYEEALLDFAISL